MANTVRTLIVDDSSMARTLMRNALRKHPDIEVIDSASDGVEALEKIRALKPDVVTLDIEMPRLNGIGVLERVVGKAPVSFVMVSSLTQAGAQVTFEALNKGAFDYVTKPASGSFKVLPGFEERLQRLVVAAAKSKGRRAVARPIDASKSAAPTLPPCKERGWIVAIGISCGGPQTLMRMMPQFPSDFPPILITQHMPAGFTASFANSLNNICSVNVKEAQHLDPLKRGQVYIAPGGKHMTLVRKGVSAVVHVKDGEKVSLHKPSVDVLFDSIAATMGSRSVGVIMTGMGSDGAKGMVNMHKSGAWTISQDEETSLVYGMPQVAYKTGEVDQVAPLSGIPMAISRLMQRGRRTALVASAS